MMTADYKTKQREITRDLFIFCTFTGLSFINLFALSEEDICQSEDGHVWIIKKGGKTNVESVVRLMELPRQILEKYRGSGENGSIFPIKSYGILKHQIKKLSKECGLGTDVSWHLARHAVFSFRLDARQLQGCDFR